MLAVVTVAVLGSAMALGWLVSPNNGLARLFALVGISLFPVTLLVGLCSVLFSFLSGTFPLFESWQSTLAGLITGAYGINGWYYIALSVFLWFVVASQFGDTESQTDSDATTTADNGGDSSTETRSNKRNNSTDSESTPDSSKSGENILKDDFTLADSKSPATKESQSSSLTRISGVDAEHEQKLKKAGYTSINDVSAADQSELADVPGIGWGLAVRIKTDVGDIQQSTDNSVDDEQSSSPDLVSSENIENIESDRLEKLAAEGYTTLESLRTASSFELAKIVGHGTAMEIKRQVGYVESAADTTSQESDNDRGGGTIESRGAGSDSPERTTEEKSEGSSEGGAQTEKRVGSTKFKSLRNDVESVLDAVRTDPLADPEETEAQLVRAHAKTVSLAAESPNQEEYELVQDTLDDIEQRLDRLPELIDAIEGARSRVSPSGPSQDTETETLERAREHYDEAIEMAKRAAFPTDRLERERKEITGELQRREETATTPPSGTESEVGSGRQKTTRQALIEELQRLDESTRGYPKTTELKDDSQYQPQQYYDEFGSWDDALEAAGIDKEQRLVDEIQRVDQIVDGPLTTVDIDEHSAHSSGTYSRHFGSWDAALETAGIAQAEESKTGGSGTSLSKETKTEQNETSETTEPTKADYVNAIQKVAQASDRVVKSTDVSEQSQYSAREIIRAFGSWQKALEAADVDNKSRLLQELRRLGQELGHPPTTTDMNEHGHVSATMYADYFESFTEARKRAFSDEMDKQGHLDTNTNRPHTRAKKSKQTKGGDNVNAKHASSPISEPDLAETRQKENDIIDSFETIANITADARLDRPIAVKICNISEDSGNRKQASLLVEDIDSDRCRLNIWKTHGINQTWQIDHWYVLEEARGKVWTNKRGQTKRQLSSTADLRIDHIGSEVPPKDEIGMTRHSEPKADTSSTQESRQETTEDEDESETILGEVMSEFEDMSELEDS